MTKNKHHGVINKKLVYKSMKKYQFTVEEYEEDINSIFVIIKKDYSKTFNFSFDGVIKLKVTINKKMYELFWRETYPQFTEITSKIPKESFYHIYTNGSICYAPPRRPIDEKWQLSDFINAVDSLINNYFSVEYIGVGCLNELEHGIRGLQQYEAMRNKKY